MKPEIATEPEGQYRSPPTGAPADSSRRATVDPRWNPDMTATAIDDYLHAHIPISRAMGIRVTAADADRVTLSLPLDPNRNHEHNAFGGSVSALAILTGWTFLFVRLRSITDASRIVIQRSAVHYLTPIEGDCCATVAAPPDDVWTAFMTTLNRRGRSRIVLRCEVRIKGYPAATFEGAYVAMKGRWETGFAR